jgi:FKBP-type peptidyl-prolyl cis-trans isomerase 2
MLSMSAVQLGDKIAIHYRLHGPGGEALLASADGAPLLMRVGSSAVFPGLSAGVVGMQLNEIKQLNLTPQQGFGVATTAIERSIDKEHLPADVTVGSRLCLRQGERAFTVWVLQEQMGGRWLITTKHPYAGLSLAMTVKIVVHDH